MFEMGIQISHENMATSSSDERALIGREVALEALI
jgi:hypothetical protein